MFSRWPLSISWGGWLNLVKRQDRPSRQAHRQRVSERNRFRLRLEALEDRIALATVAMSINNGGQALSGGRSAAVTVPVTVNGLLDNTVVPNQSGMSGLQLYVKYDPAVFTVSTSDVSLGTLFPGGSPAPLISVNQGT